MKVHDGSHVQQSFLKHNIAELKRLSALCICTGVYNAAQPPLLLTSSLRHYFQRAIFQTSMQIDATSRFLLFRNWEISPFHQAQRTTSAFAVLFFSSPLFGFPLSVGWGARAVELCSAEPAVGLYGVQLHAHKHAWHTNRNMLACAATLVNKQLVNEWTTSFHRTNMFEVGNLREAWMWTTVFWGCSFYGFTYRND